jgi:hypothetical protein
LNPSPTQIIRCPVDPPRLRRALLAGWAGVVAAGFGVELIRYGLALTDVEGWVSLLSLSYERNLPTWYSASLLLLCAVVLGRIGALRRARGAGEAGYWRALAVIFFYVSLDETVSLHERANAWFDLEGVLLFAWIIPAAVLLVIGAGVFGKFLWRLPRETRRSFLTAAAVFLAGGLGMELPAGYWATHHGDWNLAYALIDGAGEALELLGTTLFLAALVRHAVWESGQTEAGT